MTNICATRLQDRVSFTLKTLWRYTVDRSRCIKLVASWRSGLAHRDTPV